MSVSSVQLLGDVLMLFVCSMFTVICYLLETNRESVFVIIQLKNVLQRPIGLFLSNFLAVDV